MITKNTLFSDSNEPVALKELFIHELRCMYWTEKNSLKALLRLEKASATKYLQYCFKGHLTATMGHLQKLAEILEEKEGKARTKKCATMNKFFASVSAKIKLNERNSLLRELALVEIAREMEQYEIAEYSKLIAWANALGETKIISILEEIVNEEKEADETFVAIKEDVVKDEMFAIPEEPREPDPDVVEPHALLWI